MSSRALYFLRFLVAFTAVLGGLHYYVWRRLVRDVAESRRVRRFAAAAYFVLIALFLYGGMGGRFLGPSPLWIRWTANIWLGLIGLTVCALFALDTLRVILLRLEARRGPVSEDRRRFLARLVAGTAATAGAGLSGLSLYDATRRVGLKTLEVTLDKLPKAADGYRLVQISDVHVGPTLRREFVEQVVATVRAANPDLVAITGDLVDGEIDDLAPQLEPLRTLAPRDGVFFCTGNHEYYSGWKQWVDYLPKLGIRPLQNERIRLGAFELAGVHDWTAKDFPEAVAADVEKAVAGRDPALPLVLLAHQPRHAYEAMDNDVDLQLSGHTHGGQMFPMTWLIHLAYPFINGLYREGKFQIYVSPGTGYWGPPMRLGTTAEVTLIRLRAKA